MKLSKPPGCFLSTTNPIMSRLQTSSLLKFPGLPWSHHSRKAPWQIHKYFAITEGQEKPGLAIFCSTQQALCLPCSLYVAASAISWVLLCWPKVPGAGANNPLLFPWFPPGSSKAWPWLPLERAEGVSHMGLQWCWGSNPPSSVWVFCVPVQEGLHGTQAEAASFMVKLPTGDSQVLCFICCSSLRCLTACLGQVTSFHVTFNPSAVSYQHHVAAHSLLLGVVWSWSVRHNCYQYQGSFWLLYLHIHTFSSLLLLHLISFQFPLCCFSKKIEIYLKLIPLVTAANNPIQCCIRTQLWNFFSSCKVKVNFRME